MVFFKGLVLIVQASANDIGNFQPKKHIQDGSTFSLKFWGK